MTMLGLLLTMAALFLLLVFAAGSVAPYTSDAAGNAMAEGFVMLAGIGLWVLLAVLLLLAGFRGGLPPWTIAAAVILVPASAVAALRTAEMFAKDSSLPKWLAVVPIATPGLILAFAVCAYFPDLRGALAAPIFARILWGVVLALSILPWPTVTKHKREQDQRNAELQAAWQAKENKEQAERDAKDLQYWNETFENFPRIRRCFN